MKRFAVLLAKVAYGLVLPLYLFWFVFFSHFQYQRDDQIQRLRNKMEESLELLVNYHPDDTFFHALFQKNFVMADQHALPQEALKNRVKALKKAFPDMLEFIVWDSSGTLNKQLTGEKSFQYVLKSMFQVGRELLDHYRNVNPPKPKTMPGMQKKISLLRGYFGQFLLPELMLDFFRPSYIGRAITVSESVERRKLWMYPGDNFSVAVFISAETLKKRIGPRLLIRDFNQKSSDVKLGYFSAIDYRHAGLPKVPQLINKFRLETRKFEENAVSFRHLDDHLLLLRQVSPELIVMAYVKTFDRLVDPRIASNRAIAGILKWLLISFFIFYCLSLKNYSLQLSVQRKILLLLFFANGLPALILVSTGYEYFSARKAAIINAQQQESLRILKEIDVRFPAVRNGFSRQLHDHIEKKNQQFQAVEWPVSEIEDLKNFADGFYPTFVLLLDRHKKDRIASGRDGTAVLPGFFRDFLVRSQEFANNNDLRRRGEDGNSTIESMASEDLIYLDFVRFLNKINLQNTGDTTSWTFIKLIGDYKNFNSWGIFSALWSREDMLRTFVKKEFSRIEAEIFPRRLGLMEIDSKTIMPDDLAKQPLMQRLMHKTALRREFLNDEVTVGSHSYLFSGIVGNEMQDAALVVLYPRSLVEQQVNSFKITLFLVGLVILLVLFQLVRLFSNRLLSPVKELEKGIEKLQQGDFRFRIEGGGDDELGQLVSAFNSTMQGLEGLAVGTALQESLLPDSHFQREKITLFARSLFMSKMGGDYFDFFESQPGRVGIIFGDVAGHGIPAAVIMAMAKAVVASSSVKFSAPADMLARVNQVLLYLKEKKLRRMMTCQCLDLNCKTGEFAIANAGHCYPVHIRNRGGQAEYIKINGMPLGNRLKKPYDTQTFQMQPGDILVLYTDGIIEAVNKDGEVFDFNRFLQLLQDSYNEDLEVFWQGIIEGNRKWSCQQDDDLTFMLIRCEE